MTAVAWIALTVALYAGARLVYRRARSALLSPLLVVPALLVAALLAGRVGYDRYMLGGRWLAWLLAPTTVAFAVPLHRHRALMRHHLPELGPALLAGSAAAVASTVALARALGLGPLLTRSMVPRSITTPLAMIVAEDLGGAPTLAAACVIVTALVGIAIGPWLARRLRSAAARGALFGMGAHGAGTARAMELGPIEGAISAVVMICAGLLLLVCVPILRWVAG